MREDTIPFHGFETWYRVVGDGEDPGKLPLLCLHGGPGATWHHLEPYEALAQGRRVIFYDQLGCGSSSVSEPHDPAMWTTELYVEEVGAIREALGLDRVHVLGHSWGGMLGMAYAITQPPGVASLVIESSPPSVPFWMTELAKLRAALPPVQVFYDRHLCRVPIPDFLQRTFDGLAANPEVYHHMNGPSEFHVIGTIKDWDVTDRLDRIEAPTLVFCGRYDEVTPAAAIKAHERIPGSEFVVMEESSHMSQAEQPEETLAMLRDWLARNEAGA